MNLVTLRKFIALEGGRTNSELQVSGKEIVDAYIDADGVVQLVLEEEFEEVEEVDEDTVHSRFTHKTETEERSDGISEESDEDSI